MRTRRTAILLLAVLASIGGGPAAAQDGVIEVVVRERDGRPLAGEAVVTRPLEDPPPAAGRRYGFGTTDARGRVRFTDLAPGRYAVELRGLHHPDMVLPADNPYHQPPVVTLLAGDERPQRVEIELWPGVPVAAELRVSDDSYRLFRVLYHHLQTGRTLSASPFGGLLIERRLVAGDWLLSVEPPAGYLLVAVEHNGHASDRHQVRLDLAGDPGDHLVTWTYVAPARLTGVVEAEGGPLIPIEVSASLVEPGPWIDAARRLGGSRFERVSTLTDPTNGRYEMVLPDGRWRVAPSAANLAQSEPEERSVVLAPGDVGQADFYVRFDGRLAAEEGLALIVRVRRADGGPVEGAKVAVLPPPGGAGVALPLVAGETRRGGVAKLPGLASGSYRLVAAHRDFVEGESLLRIEENRPQRGEVELATGAEVWLEARDGGRPLPGVELAIERLGEAPAMTLDDDEIRAAKLRRVITSDQSGRASATGLYPGRHRLTARLLGEAGVDGRIELAVEYGDEGFAPVLETELAEGTARLWARRVAAASLTLTAACDDGMRPPPTAAARVVPLETSAAFAGEDGAERLARASAADGILALDRLPFGGAGRDRLRIGPLSPGVYRLALRPEGFTRWTWAFTATDPLRADDLQVLADDVVTDLGLFHLECAPAVDLRPRVLDGGPLPDLRAAEVTARILATGRDEELARPSIAQDEDAVRLRLLPTGRWRLVFTLRHPHFLPRPDLSFEATLELQRGGYQIGEPRIEAIGGALRLDCDDGVVRVRSLAGEPPSTSRQVPCTGERTLVPSLPPGPYRVDLCAGASCNPPRKRWPRVTVERGRTVELEFRSGAAPGPE
ncbi:MAG: carboxypeptidase regulatory-like domain-containing protein [Acidobacteria bacterium]|nr:MAG: carboxypeptidase regulatory-like domain-containing protein [Acidobacteriota bacterium]